MGHLFMKTMINSFLEDLERERRRSANTVQAYRVDLAQFLQVLSEGTPSNLQASDITGDGVAGYMRWLQHQGYRPATVSRKVAAVRTFLEFVRRTQGVPDSQVLDGLRIVPPPRKQPRVLTRQELTDLLRGPERLGSPRGLRDAAILWMLYVTGLRATDAVELKVDDVDKVQGDIRCPWDPTFRLPMGMSAPSLLKYLEEGRPHLVRNPEERALFLNQRGEKLSRQGLWLVVKRWAREVGLGDDLSPHSLRHTLAHDLFLQGKSRREVQKRLGLKSPSAIRVGVEGRDRGQG